MKKLLLIMVFVLLLGCQEEERKQHPTTLGQMQVLAKWTQAVEERFAAVDNNLLYLYRRLPDPNDVVLWSDLVAQDDGFHGPQKGDE